MARGDERIARMAAALQDAELDALVCTLPANVLMLSGYMRHCDVVTLTDAGPEVLTPFLADLDALIIER